jgi:uncharacterized protein (UPF0333 family)
MRLKELFEDNRGQVSLEYLIMVVFGVMLEIITGIMIINLGLLISVAKAKILNYRDNILATI